MSASTTKVRLPLPETKSVIHDFEPDIEAFYKEWVNLPVPERAD